LSFSKLRAFGLEEVGINQAIVMSARVDLVEFSPHESAGMNRFVSTSPGDSKDGAGDGEGFAVATWPSAVVATAIRRMRRCVFIVQGLCQDGISWLFF
jgi:hypothetical protein